MSTVKVPLVRLRFTVAHMDPALHILEISSRKL